MNLYQSLSILILNQVYRDFAVLSDDLKEFANETTNLNTRNVIERLCLNVKCIRNDNRKFLLTEKSVDETKKEIIIEYNSVLQKLADAQFDLNNPYDIIRIGNIQHELKNKAKMHGIPCVYSVQSKIRTR